MASWTLREISDLWDAVYYQKVQHYTHKHGKNATIDDEDFILSMALQPDWVKVADFVKTKGPSDCLVRTMTGLPTKVEMDAARILGELPPGFQGCEALYAKKVLKDGDNYHDANAEIQQSATLDDDDFGYMSVDEPIEHQDTAAPRSINQAHKIVELQVKLSSRDAKITGLRQQISDLESQLGRSPILELELLKLEQANAALEDERVSALQQVAELKSAQEAKDLETEAASRDLETIMKKKYEVEHELMEKEATLDDTQARTEELEEEIGMALQSLAKFKKMADAFEARAVEAEAAKQRAREEEADKQTPDEDAPEPDPKMVIQLRQTQSELYWERQACQELRDGMRELEAQLVAASEVKTDAGGIRRRGGAFGGNAKLLTKLLHTHDELESERHQCKEQRAIVRELKNKLTEANRALTKAEAESSRQAGNKGSPNGDRKLASQLRQTQSELYWEKQICQELRDRVKELEDQIAHLAVANMTHGNAESGDTGFRARSGAFGGDTKLVIELRKIQDELESERHELGKQRGRVAELEERLAQAPETAQSASEANEDTIGLRRRGGSFGGDTKLIVQLRKVQGELHSKRDECEVQRERIVELEFAAKQVAKDVVDQGTESDQDEDVELLKSELINKDKELEEVYDQLQLLKEEAGKSLDAFERLQRLKEEEKRMEEAKQGDVSVTDVSALARDEVIVKYHKLERLLQNERNLSRMKDSELFQLDADIEEYEAELDLREEEMNDLMRQLQAALEALGRDDAENGGDAEPLPRRELEKKLNAVLSEREQKRLREEGQDQTGDQSPSTSNVQALKKEQEGLVETNRKLHEMVEDERRQNDEGREAVSKLLGIIERKEKELDDLREQIVEPAPLGAISERIAMSLGDIEAAPQEDKLEIALTCIRDLQGQLDQSLAVLEKFKQVDNEMSKIINDRARILAQLDTSEGLRKQLQERLNSLQQILEKEEGKAKECEERAFNFGDEVLDFQERVQAQEVELRKLRASLIENRLWAVRKEPEEQKLGDAITNADSEPLPGFLPLNSLPTLAQSELEEDLDLPPGSPATREADLLNDKERITTELEWATASLQSAAIVRNNLQNHIDRLQATMQAKDGTLAAAHTRIQELEDLVCDATNQESVRLRAYMEAAAKVKAQTTDMALTVDEANEELKREVEVQRSACIAAQAALIEREVHVAYLRNQLVQNERELNSLNEQLMRMEGRFTAMEYESNRMASKTRRKSARLDEIKERLHEFLDTTETTDEELMRITSGGKM